jgi:broad specificity phosphatase PhoE
VIRLYLVRHGECVRPEGGGLLGQNDVELTELGVRQARSAGLRLAEVPFTRAVSSDLCRAAETARLVLGERDLPLALDPRVREVDIGAWEGLTWDAINANYADASTGFRSPGFAFPDGESVHEVADRVGAVLEEMRAGPEGDVLLVGHFGALSLLLTRALALPDTRWGQFTLEYASITTLHLYEDMAVLTGLNDRAHLVEVA